MRSTSCQPAERSRPRNSSQRLCSQSSGTMPKTSTSSSISPQCWRQSALKAAIAMRSAAPRWRHGRRNRRSGRGGTARSSAPYRSVPAGPGNSAAARDRRWPRQRVASGGRPASASRRRRKASGQQRGTQLASASRRGSSVPCELVMPPSQRRRASASSVARRASPGKQQRTAGVAAAGRDGRIHAARLFVGHGFRLAAVVVFQARQLEEAGALAARARSLSWSMAAAVVARLASARAVRAGVEPQAAVGKVVQVGARAADFLGIGGDAQPAARRSGARGH
jgi:hypothetical protein